jgi:hypothetical protein
MVPEANPPTPPAATGQPPAQALETPAIARVRMTAATAGTFTGLFILILRIKSFFFRESDASASGPLQSAAIKLPYHWIRAILHTIPPEKGLKSICRTENASLVIISWAQR